MLLRKAAVPLVPSELLRRRKRGFSIPAAAWLRGELEPFARETLSPDTLRRQGFFHPGAVTRLIDDHVAGREDLSRQLWGLLAFTLWHERHVERTPGVTATSLLGSWHDFLGFLGAAAGAGPEGTVFSTRARRAPCGRRLQAAEPGCAGREPPGSEVKVWVDISAPAHVLVFRPLIGLLEERGDEVEVTTRDYAQTLELLERHGIEAEVIGATAAAPVWAKRPRSPADCEP